MASVTIMPAPVSLTALSAASISIELRPSSFVRASWADLRQAPQLRWTPDKRDGVAFLTLLDVVVGEREVFVAERGFAEEAVFGQSFDPGLRRLFVASFEGERPTVEVRFRVGDSGDLFQRRLRISDAGVARKMNPAHGDQSHIVSRPSDGHEQRGESTNSNGDRFHREYSWI
jgi:hypothetical protein